jgi:hypothetical protein
VALNETVSAGEYWSFQQRIEKPQMILEGEQTFTLSFWARATSGTVSASAFSYGIVARENSPELPTTWKKITYTFTTTISSSNAYASCYVIYFSAGATATSIDIAQVQLEVGDTATPFEHRSYGEELLACKRYFHKQERNAGGGGNDVLGIRIDGISNSRWEQTLPGCPVPMRADPSVSYVTGSLSATSNNIVSARGAGRYLYMQTDFSGTPKYFYLNSYTMDAEL